MNRLALYRVIALSIGGCSCLRVLFCFGLFLTWVEFVASDDVLGISKNGLLVALVKRVE